MVQNRNKKQKIEKTVTKNKKSIKFNNIKYIYYTYASTEYDRTSIEVGDNFNDDLNDYLNNNFDNIDILKDICDIKYEIDLLTYFKNN
jgi:hypothetical protein